MEKWCDINGTKTKHDKKRVNVKAKQHHGKQFAFWMLLWEKKRDFERVLHVKKAYQTKQINDSFKIGCLQKQVIMTCTTRLNGSKISFKNNTSFS